jgi:hypothetical protein
VFLPDPSVDLADRVREWTRVLKRGGAIAIGSFLTFALVLFECAGYGYPGIRLHTAQEAFCKGVAGTILAYVSLGGTIAGIIMIVVAEWKTLQLRRLSKS